MYEVAQAGCADCAAPSAPVAAARLRNKREVSLGTLAVVGQAAATAERAPSSISSREHAMARPRRQNTEATLAQEAGPSQERPTQDHRKRMRTGPFRVQGSSALAVWLTPQPGLGRRDSEVESSSCACCGNHTAGRRPGCSQCTKRSAACTDCTLGRHRHPRRQPWQADLATRPAEGAKVLGPTLTICG